MSSVLDRLNNHQFISLTTFRKTGDPVPTPVWFARADDKLFIYTQTSSGKVRRIRHTTRVTVAPCKANGELLGEAFEARARIIEDAAERKRADDLLTQKYGLMKRLFLLLGRLRGAKDADRAYLEISV
jgi:uncharacterized protein